jgi:hypothetical protein
VSIAITPHLSSQGKDCSRSACHHVRKGMLGSSGAPPWPQPAGYIAACCLLQEATGGVGMKQLRCVSCAAAVLANGPATPAFSHHARSLHSAQQQVTVLVHHSLGDDSVACKTYVT